MSDDCVSQYTVPCWDCPECGAVNAGWGQDDLSGPQRCEDCTAHVEVAP